MNNALVAANANRLENIFASDYIFTTPVGTTLNKAQRIASVVSRERNVSSIEFPHLEIPVYGDAAVGVSEYREMVEPQHKKQSGRITNVFVRMDGHWKMVAGQSWSADVSQSAHS